MRRSKRMLPLLNLAEKKQEAALMDMAKSQQTLKEYKTKLEMMKEYRNEYSSHTLSSTSTASMLRDKQNFVLQIDQAITLLEQQLGKETHQHSLVQKEWIEARQKTDALDKVIDNFRLTENTQQELKEQRQADDQVCKTRPK